MEVGWRNDHVELIGQSPSDDLLMLGKNSLIDVLGNEVKTKRAKDIPHPRALLTKYDFDKGLYDKEAERVCP